MELSCIVILCQCKTGTMKGKELNDMTVRQLDGAELSPIRLVSLHS